MNKINRVVVLSFALAFVSFWFGYQEVAHAKDWVALVPGFLASVGEQLVFLHGILLIILGLALVFDFHRRMAAFILALMLLDIIIILFYMAGLNDVVVRDIGLFGMALALTLKS